MVDNNMVYKARLHWIIFLGPVVLFCLGLLLGFKAVSLQPVAYFFMVFSIAWGGVVGITDRWSFFIISKKNVVLHTGFWVRNTMDIPLSKIESIDIRRTLMGSLFQYGTLIITGTGGSRQLVYYLNKPLTCRRYIEQLMHGSSG
jgi:uncharacterized membrane protein YdbT with pleckstrin-like domain